MKTAFPNPISEVLERMASFCGTSLDQLVSLDLSLIDTDELLRQKNETAADISGDTLRVLATTVSPDNEENVEVVPASARAGYAAGYDDPEFVASLPHMSLPFLSPQKKYRAFPVTGDSMPPVAQGSYVVGQYLVDWRDLREGQYAVVVTREDGIVFKKTYPDFKNGKATACFDKSRLQPIRYRFVPSTGNMGFRRIRFADNNGNNIPGRPDAKASGGTEKRRLRTEEQSRHVNLPREKTRKSGIIYPAFTRFCAYPVFYFITGSFSLAAE